MHHIPYFQIQFSASHHQVVTTPKPVETTTTSSGFNLGNVFNFLSPLIQSKPDTILYDSPVIKTLPAPDLTKVSDSIYPDDDANDYKNEVSFKVGPPVIELGGGYAEGGEELYVQRLEANRRKDHRTRHPTHHNNDHHVHHVQEDHSQQQHHHHQQHQQSQHQQHHGHHQAQQHENHHDQQQHDRHDHLASFVDVDFEHFVPGQVEDIEPPRPTHFTKPKTSTKSRTKHPHLNNHPGNFSVLVSGLKKNPNPKELAKLVSILALRKNTTILFTKFISLFFAVQGRFCRRRQTQSLHHRQ